MQRPDYLTAHQIADAFKEEALSLGPREYAKINRALKPVREMNAWIEEYDCEPWMHRVMHEMTESIIKWYRKDLYAKMIYLPKLKKIIQLAEIPIEARKDMPTLGPKIEEAKQFPIEQLYQFDKIKRVGRRIYGCCPFHNETTPSFFIDQNNKFHCFGCNAHGTSIDFFMKLESVSFKDAVLRLTGEN